VLMDTREKHNNGKCGLLYAGAGILLILSWLSLWFASNPAGLRALRYVGWLIFALGGVLILLPILVLRSQGKPEEGKDWTHSTVIVNRGLYAVVRHPLYLGWSLMYIAVALFGQNWLTVFLAIPGIGCLYLISREEDRQLLNKFGDAYARYVRSVPAMNILVGVFRLLQHRENTRRLES